jgi:hypothetical protein
MYDAALVLAPRDDARVAALVWLDKSRAVAIVHGQAEGVAAVVTGIALLSDGGSGSVDAHSTLALSQLFTAAGSYTASPNSSATNYTSAYRSFMSTLRLDPQSTDALMYIANIVPHLRRKNVYANGGTQVSPSVSNVLYFSCTHRLARLGYFHRPDGSMSPEKNAREFFNVIMTPDELTVFHNSLLPLRESRALFFEFGIGGSTRYARSLLPAAQMAGLDSSRDWVGDLAREMPELAARLRWIDVGPTVGWGYPAQETEQQHAHLFPAYSAAIYEWVNFSSSSSSSSSREGAPPPHQPAGIGLALVDGRFRVACAAAAALALAPGGRVLVHDYKQRSHYAEIETVMDLLSVVDTLAVFRVRRDAAAAGAARLLYEKFKLDAR